MRIKLDNVDSRNADAAFVVYKATNIINGKFYIGATRRGFLSRRNQHLWDLSKGSNGSPKFYRAMRKYGVDNFYWEVIAVVSSVEELMQKEIELIAELKPEYNITLGGQGVLGVFKTPEQRAKISKSLMGHVGSCPMLGKNHSDETKARLRELGFAGLEKFKQYQHLGPDSLKKKVVCLNSGEVFECARVAAKKFGLDKVVVTEVCLRRPFRKSAGGLIFRYFGDHFGGKEEVESIRRSYKIIPKRIAKVFETYNG